MANEESSTKIDFGAGQQQEGSSPEKASRGADKVTGLDGTKQEKRRVKELGVAREGEKRHRILIAKGESDDDKEGVFVSFNGERDFVVPRGIEVIVPDVVFNILSDARRTVLTEDGAVNYEAPRFNIQYLGQAA